MVCLAGEMGREEKEGCCPGDGDRVRGDCRCLVGDE